MLYTTITTCYSVSLRHLKVLNDIIITTLLVANPVSPKWTYTNDRPLLPSTGTDKTVNVKDLLALSLLRLPSMCHFDNLHSSA
jgi:hypothetical protein